MTIAALITEGIGPGSSQLFLFTRGLGSGKAPPIVTVSDNFIPLSDKQLKKLKAEAKEREERRALEFELQAKEREELHKQIMDTLHPEQIIIEHERPRQKVEIKDSDEEDDIEFLMIYG